jgi:hypothetical protein
LPKASAFSKRQRSATPFSLAARRARPSASSERSTNSQAGQEGAVVALVEEPASLLAGARIGQESGAVLDQLDRPIEGARHQLGLGDRQAFQATHRARAIPDDRPGRQRLGQRLKQERLQPVDAGRVRLRHHDVAETVDHQTRQAVGLGVDETVIWLVVKTLAQAQRAANSLADPTGIKGGVRRPVEHADRDQGVRVEIAHPQLFPAGIDQADRRAGRQRLGLLRHVDFVRIHPRVAGAHSARPSLLQTQHERRHGWIFLVRHRANLNSWHQKRQ